MTVRIVPVLAVSLLLTSAAAAQNSGPAPAETPAATAGTSTPATGAVVSRDAAPAPAPAAVDTAKDYRIGPDDVLNVWVFDQDDLTREVQVRPDGKITLPFVNDVVAAGKTTNELRAILTEGWKPYVQNPEVAVGVKQVRSARVSVLGAVRMPNIYELPTGATVLDMISKAQGFTDFANRGDIVLIRANGERIKLNWGDMVNGKQTNHVVRPGDTIVVND
jgi:polysaccharide export outer membrane protein